MSSFQLSGTTGGKPTASPGFRRAIQQIQIPHVPAHRKAAGIDGTCLGTGVADTVSGGLFKFILYPSIFSEDRRYYRLGEGSGGTRFGHAMMHAFIAHRDNGTEIFNFSE